MPRAPASIRIQPTTWRLMPLTSTFRAKVRIAPSASRTMAVPSRIANSLPHGPERVSGTQEPTAVAAGGPVPRPADTQPPHLGVLPRTGVSEAPLDRFAPGEPR